MKNIWENFFRKEGAAWKFLPSDSAQVAVDLFKSGGFVKVLIPGCGYGRNARLFAENGFDVTGIEISGSAIRIARENGLNFRMHHGSVTDMPFDSDTYDGIYCYALLHLLNKFERKKFIHDCYRQLRPGGIMMLIVASKKMSAFGQGIYLSRNRYKTSNGLKVFFYDSEAVRNEFSAFGDPEYREYSEPVKFIENCDPLEMIMITVRKPSVQ